MKQKTKQIAIDIIKFFDNLKTCKASAVITYQLVKSATSVGANYRASCVARSKNEFFSKVSIVVEESDESEYWLEVIEGSNLSSSIEELKQLHNEANEISKIMSKARKTVSKY